MSAKQRRGRQTRTIPWPLLLAVGGLVVLLAAFLFATRGGGGPSGGTPKITADPQNIDYGYVKFGNNEQFTIKVTNAGAGLLRFTEKPYIEILEGC